MLQDLSVITDIDKFDFPVEIREMNFPGPYMHTDSGGAFGNAVRKNEKIPPSLGRVIVRTDTEMPLGIVGPSWKLTGYGDMLRTFNNSLINSGLDLDGAIVQDRLFEGGAKMRREIVLKRHNIQPQVGDLAGLRLRVFDSYNMNWARQMVIDVLRFWCSNGCYHPMLSHRFYSKHTRAHGHIQFTADEAAKTVANLKLVEDSLGHWIAKPVTEEDAKGLYANTIARYRDPKGKMRTSDKLVKDLMENFHGQQLLNGGNQHGKPRENLYNVYQGATAWATHVGETKRGAAHNIQRTRESQIRDMVTSDAWKHFSHAA